MMASHIPVWLLSFIQAFHSFHFYFILVLFLQTLSQLNCEYKMINESRMVVCDLGNPMVTGTEVRSDAEKKKS